MSFADHFSSIAAAYATYRPHYPASVAAELAVRCEQRELAWEVGCGSGQLTGDLATHFTRVIATDPAQAQLDAATPHPHVEYRCVPAEASGLPDTCADLIVAAQAAHWFDWPRFVAEVGRVAKPGAVVALVSYGIVEIDGPIRRALAHYYRDTLAGYWPPARRHVESGYRDLAWPWAELSPPALVMRAEWTRDEFTGYVATWSATTKLVAATGPAPYDAFCAELAASWPADQRREIRWPLTMRLARYSLP